MKQANTPTSKTVMMMMMMMMAWWPKLVSTINSHDTTRKRDWQRFLPRSLHREGGLTASSMHRYGEQRRLSGTNAEHRETASILLITATIVSHHLRQADRQSAVCELHIAIGVTLRWQSHGSAGESVHVAQQQTVANTVPSTTCLLYTSPSPRDRG